MMSTDINNQYLREYADKFTGKICDAYFSQKKYMTGQEIVQLTPSVQVNFFVIKALFEAWQLELEKLKSNPYFDYRDIAVHNALKEFMNVLSRTIKIERKDFEPLLRKAVGDAVMLAVNPLAFYESELDRCHASQLNQYLKENKKYFKWHVNLIENLIDRASISHTHQAYKQALQQNFEQKKNSLESKESLLGTISHVVPIENSLLFKLQEEQISAELEEKDTAVEEATSEISEEIKASGKKEEPVLERTILAEKKTEAQQSYTTSSSPNAFDPIEIWSRFESEEYSIMKGTIKDLSESVGINQRFMFTKELFVGNPDLLQHALKSIDQCESFMDAINLINQRYVDELKWDKNAEPVHEFLQLVFRKFDQRG
ncbi:hypothetical protein [Fontibacter flavus]|uniref:TerB-C domain-containing protein n=1 Tax=Fontibacter flavus TaxID=654838 RepID=A0ABV6FVU9_9BACT